MAAYRRVYESHHLQADCQEPGSVPEPYARVRATFTFFINVRSGKLKAVVWCLSVFLVFLAHPGCAKLWAFVLLRLLFFFF